MSNPFIAEIQIFAGNFAPKGWATCDGQILPIAQNTALFSLLGTTYGGDGKSTFGLPNLQGTAPLGAGQGPGLSEYFLGETGGSQSVNLVQSEIPAHTHPLNASSEPALDDDPGNQYLARGRGLGLYTAAANQTAVMAPEAVTITGGSQPHNNMPPYLTLNFIIALQGLFPARG